MGQNVTVIIPVFNEEEYIISTLKGIRQVKAINEIIVVDDGSKDSTYELLKKEKDIILLRNNYNRGKGHAVSLGLKHASNRYIALADGDLGETASEFIKLTDAIENEGEAIIVGLLPAAGKKGGFGIVKSISRNGMYLLTSQMVKSVLSGQRVVPAAFLKQIELPGDFSLEFKITLEALRQGLKIVEVPVEMSHRETGRDIKGFWHRGVQCRDICRLIGKELFGKQGMK